MANILADRDVAHEIAGRIRLLIARQDEGDVTVAARRLARPIADVCSLERVIASGDGPAGVEFLAEVVRSYDADAVWLITGGTSRSYARFSTEVRGTIVEVLAELSDNLLNEARELNASVSRGQSH